MPGCFSESKSGVGGAGVWTRVRCWQPSPAGVGQGTNPQFFSLPRNAMSKSTLSREQLALARLLEQPDNRLCADCGTKGACEERAPAQQAHSKMCPSAASAFSHPPALPPSARRPHVGVLQPGLLHVHRLLRHPPHDRDARHQGANTREHDSLCPPQAPDLFLRSPPCERTPRPLTPPAARRSPCAFRRSRARLSTSGSSRGSTS